ncbi:hypothetical protein OG984_06485 [Nocardioides sp. NBC_00368]|uniref:hypothetical protein n=1 Tax=Nocardioides sp. NBC_00368 TaxID=2976000 RepID=UPI002E21319B
MASLPIDSTALLRVEVEKVADGPRNWIQNHSGIKGAWGWRSDNATLRGITNGASEEKLQTAWQISAYNSTTKTFTVLAQPGFSLLDHFAVGDTFFWVPSTGLVSVSSDGEPHTVSAVTATTISTTETFSVAPLNSGYIATTGTHFRMTTGGAGGSNPPRSSADSPLFDVPVQAGEWIAARLNVVGIRDANQEAPGNTYLGVRTFFIDANGTYISNSLSAFVHTQKIGALDVAPRQVPAGAAFACLAIDVKSSVDGVTFTNPTEAGGNLRFNRVVMTTAATAAEINLAGIPPVEWIDVMPESIDMDIQREGLEVGTLSLSARSAALDPAVNDVLVTGRKIKASTLVNGVWEPVFVGRLTHAEVSYDLELPDPDDRVGITLTAVDNTQDLGNTKAPEVLDPAGTQGIQAMLEASPVPYNVNGASYAPSWDAYVIGINESANLLEQVRLVGDSSTTPVYAHVRRDGVFKVWSESLDPAAVPVTTSDFTDVQVGWDSENCINEVNVQFLRFNPVTSATEEIPYGPYRDNASVRRWGVHKADMKVSRPAEDAAEIKTIAEKFLAANGTPTKRVRSMTIPIAQRVRSEFGDFDVPSTAAHLALLDLGDLIQVDSGVLPVETLRITGISHRITHDGWFVELVFEKADGIAQPIVYPAVTSTTYETAWTGLPQTSGVAVTGAPEWRILNNCLVIRFDDTTLAADWAIDNGGNATDINFSAVPAEYRPGFQVDFLLQMGSVVCFGTVYPGGTVALKSADSRGGAYTATAGNPIRGLVSIPLF